MGPSCNTFTIQCPSPASYFFWDVAHPSERAYQATLGQVLQTHNYDLNSYNISRTLHPFNVSTLSFNY